MTLTTTIHMTPEERVALRAAAEAAGLGPSSYARRVVMRSLGLEPKVRRRPSEMAAAIGRMLGTLGRIGSNLNQLARAANRGVQVPAASVDVAQAELAQLTAAVMALRQEPPR